MQVFVGSLRVLVENRYFNVEYESLFAPRLMRATRSAEFESLAKQAMAGHGRFSGDKHGPVTTGRLPWWACPKEKMRGCVPM